MAEHAGSRQKTFCEFFAGIGLVRLGLEPGGWRCVYAGDIDPAKAAMYRHHFADAEGDGGDVVDGDVGAEGARPDQNAGQIADHYAVQDVWDTAGVMSKIDQGDDRPALATASFPCTDMSLAGRQRGFTEGSESSAFFGFAQVLKQMGDRRPPLVLLENVAGFLTTRGGDDFRAAAHCLAELGYFLDAFLLDAAWFTPQSRQRLFVLGVRGSLDELHAAGLAVRQGAGLMDDWRQAVSLSPRVRPERLLAAMADDLPTGWIAAPLPEPPARRDDVMACIDLDREQDWWDAAQVARHVAMFSDAHRAKVEAWQAAKATVAATAFRRIRQKQQRLEVRFDGLAGCLRTPRGGSARQIVVAVIAGKLKMRWMSPREYARLQGAPHYRMNVRPNKALFGFGDAVCSPVLSWIDKHALTPIYQHLAAPANRSHFARSTPMANTGDTRN